MSLCCNADATLNPRTARPTISIPASTQSPPAGTAGLLSLDIRDYRNISAASLSFTGGLNLITGANAAGKTSLLEAVYCLGRVRSFRTSDADRQIREGQPAFRLVGQVAVQEGRKMPIGIERQPGRFTIHAAGEPVRRLSDLAGNFPVHIMTADTETVLNGGPRYRRQLLDWALFHVEQGYRQVWQRYARSLRQRNAALRASAPANQISSWDPELVDAGDMLDRMRRDYLQNLEPLIAAELRQLLPQLEFSLRYQGGWSRERSFTEALQASIDSDRARGFTHAGPHRADFSLWLNGKSVPSHFSRGQQKAVVVAFMIGQVRLQHRQGRTGGAFLLDDLGSELDAGHQARVLSALAELGTQVFVTAIDAAALDLSAWPDRKMFHVEHGCIHHQP